MKKLLLDTHAFIWSFDSPEQLSPRAVTAIKDPQASIWVSVVSIWEIMMKRQAGKLTLTRSVRDILDDQRRNGIGILDAALEHVLALEPLPMIHKDPFDRILVAQAVAEGMALVSVDTVLSKYPVDVIW